MNDRNYVEKDGKKIEKTIADEGTTVKSKNPIIREFFKKKFRIAFKYAKLNKEDIILDFGCGEGYIKRKNPDFNVIGYDVNPLQSDVKDYTTVKPTKIFATDVFEHIDKKEIRKIVKNFKKMSDEFDLIVIVPTENWLSRKARRLLGKPERVRDHITTMKEILEILDEEFELKEKKNFLTVSYIARYHHPKNLQKL